ncbi:MAG: rod shape-determining protein RodA [Tepidiformaceae bacterium]
MFRGTQTPQEWARFDYLLVLIALALVAYGLILIHSGSTESGEGLKISFNSPMIRQGIFAIGSLVAMILLSRMDYHALLHYAWWIYGITIFLLILLLIIGQTDFGSTRWFDLGIFQLQPSEFAKISLIIVLARLISDRGGDVKSLKTLLFSLLLAIPPLFLVFIQPDLGTSIIFITIWVGLVFVAGATRRHLIILGAFFIALIPFVWTFGVEDYQIERISVVLNAEEDPLDSGYNPIQAQIAIGSGGLFGKGLFEGEQTQLNFLKVPTKDFIFSVLGEELGFLGAILLLGLFLLLLWRILRAAQFSGDTSGQLLAAGIVTMILFQLFINIAVNLGIFPVTGLPLPFVSAGGSSLLTLFISLGIVQSVVIHHRAYRQN